MGGALSREEDATLERINEENDRTLTSQGSDLSRIALDKVWVHLDTACRVVERLLVAFQLRGYEVL